MVTAALASLFAKPQGDRRAPSAGFFKKKARRRRTSCAHIELPLWISFVGVPIVGAIGVWMIHAWFGVRLDLGALAIPLIIVLTLIAANSTALTGITPTGSLSQDPAVPLRHAATRATRRPTS